MPGAGARYRLILYTYTLNRWWRATLAIGIALLIMTAGLGAIPLYFPQFPVVWVDDWKLWVTAAAGGLAILITILLAAIRRSAYLRLFPDHLRLVTPFLRLNISYRRLRRSYTTTLGQLFPRLKGWKREFIRPMATRTVVVLDLTGLPLGRFSLGLFLSPFFFPGRTAQLALLVPDWMAFSTELDSLRSAWQGRRQRPPGQPSAAGLFGSLGGKK
ncbi:MAG: hypothetical protein JXB85_15675 [Anaerolineales bacterium]|nr:hypothetical protein [Anaerolineales bacterium]